MSSSHHFEVPSLDRSAEGGMDVLWELDELPLAVALTPVAPPNAVRDAVLERIRKAEAENPADRSKRTVRATEGTWRPQPIPGLEVKELSFDEKRGATILFRLAAGASFPQHRHHGAEECYVITGSVRIGDLTLYAGDFHHAAAGSQHGTLTSDGGCILLLVVDPADYTVA